MCGARLQLDGGKSSTQVRTPSLDRSFFPSRPQSPFISKPFPSKLTSVGGVALEKRQHSVYRTRYFISRRLRLPKSVTRRVNWQRYRSQEQPRAWLISAVMSCPRDSGKRSEEERADPGERELSMAVDNPGDTQHTLLGPVLRVRLTASSLGLSPGIFARRGKMVRRSAALAWYRATSTSLAELPYRNGQGCNAGQVYTASLLHVLCRFFTFTPHCFLLKNSQRLFVNIHISS